MDKNKITTIKETYHTFKKIIIPLSVIIIAVLGSFATFYILQFSLNTPTPVVVVSSGSMRPTLNEGDLLFVKGVDSSDIQNGTIIVFHAYWAPDPSIPVVHRVVDIMEVGGVLYFKTKGDNNEQADPYISEYDVYGIVIGGIPYIGWIKLFFDSTGLLYILIAAIIIYLIISIVLDYNKEKKNQNTADKENKLQKIKKIEEPENN